LKEGEEIESKLRRRIETGQMGNLAAPKVGNVMPTFGKAAALK